MFGFFLKKNFCDGWDNLFTLVLINLVFLLAGGLVIGIYVILFTHTPIGTEGTTVLSVLVSAAALFLLYFSYCITAFAFGEQAANIANFGAAKIPEFFQAIPSVLKDAALYALITCAFTVLSVLGIYWYMTQGTYLCLFMGCIFIWLDLFAIITLQWFIPVRSLLKNDFKKCLKKSLILSLDNTGFSIALVFYDLVLLALSIFFLGLAPSVAGLTLARVNALRLRMYKYDYLELHPELKTKRERKEIPWEELIYEDRETLGPRKFRSFIFPWKDQ